MKKVKSVLKGRQKSGVLLFPLIAAQDRTCSSATRASRVSSNTVGPGFSVSDSRSTRISMESCHLPSKAHPLNALWVRPFNRIHFSLEVLNILSCIQLNYAATSKCVQV